MPKISEIVAPGSLEYEATIEVIKEVLGTLDRATKGMDGPNKARYSIGAVNSALVFLFNKSIKPHARLDAFEDMVSHMRAEITRGLKEGKSDGKS